MKRNKSYSHLAWFGISAKFSWFRRQLYQSFLGKQPSENALNRQTGPEKSKCWTATCHKRHVFHPSWWKKVRAHRSGWWAVVCRGWSPRGWHSGGPALVQCPESGANQIVLVNRALGSRRTKWKIPELSLKCRLCPLMGDQLSVYLWAVAQGIHQRSCSQKMATQLQIAIDPKGEPQTCRQCSTTYHTIWIGGLRLFSLGFWDKDPGSNRSECLLQNNVFHPLKIEENVKAEYGKVSWRDYSRKAEAVFFLELFGESWLKQTTLMLNKSRCLPPLSLLVWFLCPCNLNAVIIWTKQELKEFTFCGWNSSTLDRKTFSTIVQGDLTFQGFLSFWMCHELNKGSNGRWPLLMNSAFQHHTRMLNGITRNVLWRAGQQLSQKEKATTSQAFVFSKEDERLKARSHILAAFFKFKSLHAWN